MSRGSKNKNHRNHPSALDEPVHVRTFPQQASGRVEVALAASAKLPQRASGRVEVAWLRPQSSRSGPPAGWKLLGCVRKAPAAGLRQGGSLVSHRSGARSQKETTAITAVRRKDLWRCV